MESIALICIIASFVLGIYSIKASNKAKKKTLVEEEDTKNESTLLASSNNLITMQNTDVTEQNYINQINLNDYDYDTKVIINVSVPDSPKQDPQKIPKKHLIVTANDGNNGSGAIGKLGGSAIAEDSPNLFKKSGFKWKKQKRRSKKVTYSYTISNFTDENLFYQQCQSIEEYFPNIIKYPISKNPDGSLFQRYHHEKGDIVVCNHKYVGSLYISSEFDLKEYL